MPRLTVEPSKKVCRSLFGRVDHEETKVELLNEHNANIEQKSNMWNFDFKKFEPRNDNTGLQWERQLVDTPESVYKSGRSLVTALKELKSSEKVKAIKIVNESPQRRIPQRKAQRSPEKTVRFDLDSRIYGKRRRNQQTIDDFMKKQKPRSTLKPKFHHKEAIASRLRSAPSKVSA